MTSRRIAFNRLANTRDLGGMRTSDGRVIKDGMLIRSAQLVYADAEDKSRLSDMVDLVLDFRNDLEAQESPDPELPGVRYLHMPILEKLAAGMTRDENSSEHVLKDMALRPEAARVYMMGLYTNLVSSAYSISQYSRFIDLLLEDREKAVLWHCSAGKDRAGFAAVIVERLLGVPEEDIVEDYLATNIHLKGELEGIIAKVEKSIGAKSNLLREALGYLFGAKIEYLNALDAKIDELYGSFDAFARDALKVDDEKRARLRDKFLA